MTDVWFDGSDVTGGLPLFRFTGLIFIQILVGQEVANSQTSTRKMKNCKP